ncbi:MAG: threonine synthase [Aerococcaceae bacterium]|nr:threonine synthase [Aerococcaceae bacterium]
MYYKSTRNFENRVTASQAILKGIAEDGGLYVPETMPHLTFDWQLLANQSYQEVALPILQAFLPDFTTEELQECIQGAYDEKFDDAAIAPVVSFDKQLSVLELFHGNTIAFKDMALSILPYLMTTAAKKHGLQEEIVILTATSGDTGKAAMAGFADVSQTRIIVFYPKDGVSQIQERQMVTQTGENTTVIGIDGNFDDAQTMVKNLFADESLKATLKARGFQFSSANSINIGRLVPQVVYYVYAYAQLVKQGRIIAGNKVNFAVPTGNFGNILAGYYAKQLGVPIGRLICASNANNVLVDFFNQGIYDKNRPFFVTTSPSMDILVSSNLERLVYELVGGDTQHTAQLMQLLSQTGSYQVDASLLSPLQQFYANDASEAETAQAIQAVLATYHYVMDPHTAVAFSVYQKYQQQTQDDTPTVILSTASPYKFPRSVVSALETVSDDVSDIELIERLQIISNIPIPEAVTSVIHAPVRHQKVVAVNEMKQAVLDTLN